MILNILSKLILSKKKIQKLAKKWLPQKKKIMWILLWGDHHNERNSSQKLEQKRIRIENSLRLPSGALTFSKCKVGVNFESQKWHFSKKMPALGASCYDSPTSIRINELYAVLLDDSDSGLLIQGKMFRFFLHFGPICQRHDRQSQKIYLLDEINHDFRKKYFSPQFFGKK